MKKDRSTYNETVLITGASSGIGLELAREFARHQHPLVIVAPVAAEMVRLAQRLQQEFGVKVLPIAMDLTHADVPGQIFSQLQIDGLPVSILVNNAGVGQHGRFWEIPLERDLEMIRLNIEATVRLTKLFLPAMLARGQGRILNTASLASYEPGPMLAVYHATKAFVLSWSEAMATELENTGVSVTALCPGPVGTDLGPQPDRLEPRASPPANLMSPQEVAKATYAAMMKGQRIVVPGEKAVVFNRRFLSETIAARKNRKLFENLPPGALRRLPDEIQAGGRQ